MKRILAVAALALFTAACSSTPTDKVAAADAKPDPREGKEVKQVCFTQQIRNWRSNGRKSIIIERGVKDEFKLDLIGTCEPDQAFLNVGLVSRGGSSCLSWGDQLVTDAHYDGSCMIRAIHAWDESKAPKKSVETK